MAAFTFDGWIARGKRSAAPPLLTALSPSQAVTLAAARTKDRRQIKSSKPIQKKEEEEGFVPRTRADSVGRSIWVQSFIQSHSSPRSISPIDTQGSKHKEAGGGPFWWIVQNDPSKIGPLIHTRHVRHHAPLLLLPPPLVLRPPPRPPHGRGGAAAAAAVRIHQAHHPHQRGGQAAGARAGGAAAAADAPRVGPA